MKISVIIIAYNMSREIPRTVHSFLPGYQRQCDKIDVEIIVLDNGSPYPVTETDILSWPSNVHYRYLENASRSPAKALNYGVSISEGDWICPVIDGARFASPELFTKARAVSAIHPNPVIATIGYHLGRPNQQNNPTHTQDTEDLLLAQAGWPTNPEAIYPHVSLGGSAGQGYFGPISESNVLLLRREFYDILGGYDERFTIPGGGFLNLDFFKRAIEYPDVGYYLLMGEGSFHQVHGGVTTTAESPEHRQQRRATMKARYRAEYEAIRGEAFSVSKRRPILFGQANRLSLQPARAAITAMDSSK